MDSQTHSKPLKYLFASSICVVASTFSTGCKTSPQVDSPPVTLTSPIVDFGTIPEGMQAKSGIWIQNNGANSIRWKSVKATCGCTTPGILPIVKPFQKAFLRVGYDSRYRLGDIHQSIILYAEGYKQPLIIPVTGSTKKEIDVEPFTVEIPKSAVLTVFRADQKPVHVLSVEVPNSISAKVVQVSPESSKVFLKLAKESSVGLHEEKITLHLDDPKVPSWVCPVSWQVKGAFDLSPDTVNFGLVKKGTRLKSSVSIVGKDVTKLKVAFCPSNVVVRLQQIGHQEATLKIGWLANLGGLPLLHTRIVLSTGNPKEPRLIIPLYGAILPGKSGDCTSDKPCT